MENPLVPPPAKFWMKSLGGDSDDIHCVSIRPDVHALHVAGNQFSQSSTHEYAACLHAPVTDHFQVDGGSAANP